MKYHVRHDAQRFVKYQIWYYTDPVYGQKMDGIAAPLIEGPLRYSRYVIIMQNTDTLFDLGLDSRDRVLVVPCTTSDMLKFGVDVTIGKNTKASKSNIRCDLIFPVHPKSLTRYVATITSQDKIDELECMMLRLVISPRYFEDNIAVDNYTVRITPEDISNEPAENLPIVDSLKYQDTVKELDEAIANEKMPIKQKRKRRKWTTEEKEDFIQLYKSNDWNAIYKKYEIEEEKAYQYQYKFKKDLNEAHETVIETTTDDSMKIIHSGINRFASAIRNYLEDQEDLYSVVKSDWVSPRKMSRNSFYRDIRSCVVNTLNQLIGIDGIDSINGFTISDEMKSTCEFLTIIRDDDSLKKLSNALKIINEYRENIDENGGIHSKWILLLHESLSNNIPLSMPSINRIIKQYFCKFTFGDSEICE